VAERKFLDFLDMFDGGGAGKMGDKFEGGGLYSMLANALASPYGSEDEARKNARMAAYASYANNGVPITHQQQQQRPQALRPQQRPQPPIQVFGGNVPDPYADLAKIPTLTPTPTPPTPTPMYGGGPDPWADPAKFQPWAPYPEWATDPLTRKHIDYLRSIGDRDW
tara:strand:+ start:1561 stop:2058 length:498 start_codon:yes stop_codon:yes gene_type:complete